jgi:hypothetical protein
MGRAGHEKTGRTAEVIFLPSRYYKPNHEWTDEDWRQDWTARVHHRRSVKNCFTWEESRDYILGSQKHRQENIRNQDFRWFLRFWILFFGSSILIGGLLLALSACIQPIASVVGP